MPNPADLSVRTTVNGSVMQESSTKMFLHPLPKVIEFVSSFMTLQRGDVMLTGTPRGISPLSNGDVVEVTVAGCGTLQNRVVDESSEAQGSAAPFAYSISSSSEDSSTVANSPFKLAREVSCTSWAEKCFPS